MTHPIRPRDPNQLGYVSGSEDTDPKQLINAANEVPFLVTESELRDRKIKRRPKENAPRS